MLKRCPFPALLVTLLFFAGCGPAPLNIDPAEFVGTWHLLGEEGRSEITIVMNADGTFNQEVDTHGPMENLLIGDMKCSGTWKVEKGYVVWDIVESTNRKRIKEGKKYYDWIKAFEPKDYCILVNEGGLREEYHWVPKEPAPETPGEQQGNIPTF